MAEQARYGVPQRRPCCGQGTDRKRDEWMDSWYDRSVDRGWPVWSYSASAFRAIASRSCNHPNSRYSRAPFRLRCCMDGTKHMRTQTGNMWRWPGVQSTATLSPGEQLGNVSQPPRRTSPMTERHMYLGLRKTPSAAVSREWLSAISSLKWR